MLVQSNGPMIAGSGDIEKFCKNELYPKEVVYSTNANTNSELEKFWKLETIDIQKSSQDDDDDQALKHFKRTIIKQGGRYQDEVGVIHYLPHHEVLTPSKSTTKLRIVYDASAHHKGFKSLNEVLHRGPVMLPDSVGVILRFRMMKIVITADIEKHFYN
ncbi:Uncharacterized protein BM_BM17886 [Brugia malayi]|uniref:Uncharacterized protein n=1 Tax=Brugia malayi TaxID=6279 RepID=A0A4E9ERR8_BRUMA|nr:Uncharacterized protein BM_BM17886 [Brugia malayi]VIO85976.1 Uncharacterized protein BM_BM17886 [Brugia malayi]